MKSSFLNSPKLGLIIYSNIAGTGANQVGGDAATNGPLDVSRPDTSQAT